MPDAAWIILAVAASLSMFVVAVGLALFFAGKGLVKEDS